MAQREGSVETGYGWVIVFCVNGGVRSVQRAE